MTPSKPGLTPRRSSGHAGAPKPAGQRPEAIDQEPEPVPVRWGKVFNDDPMIAAAMLDRLLHRSVVLNINGDSYRMRSHRARAEATRRAVAST